MDPDTSSHQPCENLDNATFGSSSNSYSLQCFGYPSDQSPRSTKKSISRALPQSKIQKFGNSSHSKTTRLAARLFEPTLCPSPPKTLQSHIEPLFQLQGLSSSREHQPSSSLPKQKANKRRVPSGIVQTYRRKTPPNQDYIANSKSLISPKNSNTAPSPACLKSHQQSMSKKRQSTLSNQSSISQYLIERPRTQSYSEASRGASDSDDPLTNSSSTAQFINKAPQKKPITNLKTLPPNTSSAAWPSSHVQKFSKRTPAVAIPIINLTSSSPPPENPPEKTKTPPPLAVDCSNSTESAQSSPVLSLAVELEITKKATSKPVITKAREPKVKNCHIDVPVPEPVYYPFKCEWKGCKAELMNMEILRKHVYAVHAKKLEGGGCQCLWRRCGEAWEICQEDLRSATGTRSHKENSNQKWRIIYRNRREWKRHIEKHHMIPFSWHMGDGPRGSQLARPSTEWQQPHLFNAEGDQITPSVAAQPIEVGKASKLNARRFRWCYGGGIFGDDVLVPLAQASGAVSSAGSLGDTPALEEN
ncbi:hypothetical protein K3495_g6296 [Podosphaera aphanis]|nr:hypothetical protein K3495_g6296 [Podosphaera aphanis]